eukprot:gene27399-33758_t
MAESANVSTSSIDIISIVSGSLIVNSDVIVDDDDAATTFTEVLNTSVATVFTKETFISYEPEPEYEELPPDYDPPIITRNGDAVVDVTQRSIYYDSGATALDKVDGSCVVHVSGLEEVNTSAVTIAPFTITYTAEDLSGNAALPVTREGAGVQQGGACVDAVDPPGHLHSQMGIPSLQRRWSARGASAGDKAVWVVSPCELPSTLCEEFTDSIVCSDCSVLRYIYVVNPCASPDSPKCADMACSENGLCMSADLEDGDAEGEEPAPPEITINGPREMEVSQGAGYVKCTEVSTLEDICDRGASAYDVVDGVLDNE